MSGTAAPMAASAHAAEDEARSIGRELRLTFGLASLSAALIHVMAGIHHFAEWWLFGFGFMVMAVAQAASAASLAFSNASLPNYAAAALNAAIVVLWIWSRTLGLPIGPDAGDPETIGIADVMATVTEAVIIAGALMSIRGARATALSAVSNAAMLTFVAGALTGFGHFASH